MTRRNSPPAWSLVSISWGAHPLMVSHFHKQTSSRPTLCDKGDTITFTTDFSGVVYQKPALLFTRGPASITVTLHNFLCLLSAALTKNVSKRGATPLFVLTLHCHKVITPNWLGGFGKMFGGYRPWYWRSREVLIIYGFSTEFRARSTFAISYDRKS